MQWVRPSIGSVVIATTMLLSAGFSAIAYPAMDAAYDADQLK